MTQLVYTRLRAEVVDVFELPWRVLRAGGLSAYPVTLACTALVGIFALIQHATAGWWLVEHVAGVYQALPLPLILLRLPLSMLAPAPDLPAWGAMLQVVMVFALSEAHLGRMRTLITAVCVNSLTTVSARVMVIVGLHWAVGTPQVDQYELDTGPSTVVVALSIYVALVCRAYLLLMITTVAMAGEAIALPNLAGREHLVALALGAAAYLIGERIARRRPNQQRRWNRYLTPDAAQLPCAVPIPSPANPSAICGPAAATTASSPQPHAANAVPLRRTPRP